MKDMLTHLQALEEVERAVIPGILEALPEQGIDGLRNALCNVSG
jgi:hypothetical protein